MCECVFIQSGCDLTRAQWHLDILYIFAGVFLMTWTWWGPHTCTLMRAHTQKWQDSINCVRMDSLCYLWRRDPCRLERSIMRKQVTSLKDHSSNLSLSLSLSRSYTHTHTNMHRYSCVLTLQPITISFYLNLQMYLFNYFSCHSFTHCVLAAPCTLTTKGTGSISV